MSSLLSLPQELLEEILTLLVWALPVSKSVHLRSINRWFRDNYDRSLFKQKRLLAPKTTVTGHTYISHRSEQHLYDLQGVIPVTLAIKLAKHEWYNEDFMPKKLRLLIDQIERRILGFCWPYRKKDIRLVHKDVRRAVVLRMSLPDGVFPIGFTMLNYATTMLERSTKLKEICDVLNNESAFPYLTLDQNRVLDQEATALAAAVSDPRYMKSVVRFYHQPTSHLLIWHEKGDYPQYPSIPLQIAAMCGHVDNVKWLLDRASMERYSSARHGEFDKAMVLVALTGEAKVAKILTDVYHKFNFSSSEYMLFEDAPFQKACANGHLGAAKAFETLLPSAKDDKTRGRCIRGAMNRSCARGAKGPIIEYLIELGAVVKSNKTEENASMQHVPLLHAVQFGHKHLIRMLLDKGSNPHQMPSGNAFYWPIWWRDVELLKIFADAGVDLYREFPRNRDNNLREALLPIACSLGQMKVVKFMLETYPEIRNSQHARIGVEAAAEAGQRGILKLLVDNGAVSDAARGSEALFSAVQSADVHVVRVLIRAGVDLNRPSKLYCSDKTAPAGYKLMTALAVAKGHALTPSPRRVKFVKIYGLLRGAGAACRSSRWVPIQRLNQSSPEPELIDED